MFAFIVLASVLSLSSFAQDTSARGANVTDCDEMLGYFRGHAVTLDRVTRTLDRHTDVRPLYVSDTPGANLIILVSRHREHRAWLVREVGGWLNLPTVIPGPNIARVRIIPHGDPNPEVGAVPPGLFDALALVENIGAVPASYWNDETAYLSVRTSDEIRTCRKSSVVTMALVQSEFEFEEWKSHPLRTLLKNVRLENAGTDLDEGTLCGLAGIYYVGRPHEIMED